MHTTCARDHFSWSNEFPAGTTVIDGVPVHRHPVTTAKDHGAVTMLHARLDAYSTFGTSLNPRVAAIIKPYDGGNLKIMAGKAFRATAVEKLLDGTSGSAADIQKAAAVAGEGVDANSDLHASAKYRKHLAKVYTQRALTQAASRIT